MILQDHILALNILCSLKETDESNIGATGVSLGAEQSIYLASLDDRIKAVVGFGWLSDKEAMITGHNSNWSVYNLYNYFDNSDLPSLIAPRATLYSNGRLEDKKRIDSFSSDNALNTLSKINKSYKLFNKKAYYIKHKGRHEYNNQIAFKFLSKNLKFKNGK